MLANQHRGIVKSYGKVDYIILDSPIILSLTYKNYYKTDQYPATLYGETFDKLLLEIHNKYDNVNIVLERGEGVHNNNERYQDLKQSIELDKVIEETSFKFLCSCDVNFMISCAEPKVRYLKSIKKNWPRIYQFLS